MVSLPSAQWFRLSGFIIDGAQAPAGAQGVSLGNTSGLVPSHVEISYNEIRNFGPLDDHAQGILHYSGTDTALIGNRIHHIGRQTFFDHGIYMKAGRRVVVANNVISDITGGYGLHIWGDFDDSWVINNTVYASAASGFTIGGNSDRGYPDRVVTANNILAGHSGATDSSSGVCGEGVPAGRRRFDPSQPRLGERPHKPVAALALGSVRQPDARSAVRERGRARPASGRRQPRDQHRRELRAAAGREQARRAPTPPTRAPTKPADASPAAVMQTW